MKNICDSKNQTFSLRFSPMHYQIMIELNESSHLIPDMCIYIEHLEIPKKKLKLMVKCGHLAKNTHLKPLKHPFALFHHGMYRNGSHLV